MRWPWQHVAPVEHRSSYSDQVVTAILASATGSGGARPALATAALETAAQMYAGALASCQITGPSVVTRALDASWRAAVASALIRNGQCVYVISADPLDGLELRAASSFDIYGSADHYTYRIERAGPSSTRWETRDSGEVLHLRWLTDSARPWRGVSPLQRAADTGSIAGWLERRLSEEVSGPVGSFLPVAKYEPDADADLGDADADDPLASLRRDIGQAKGALLTVESQMSLADSPASAPRRDYDPRRFGADPPEGLIQLRDKVAADVGAACGIPRGLMVATGSAQSARESWRQWIAGGVDGLARRIEAQVLAQLGVEIRIDSTPLAGRDLAARAAAFARLAKGGVPIADARAAAGI